MMNVAKKGLAEVLLPEMNGNGSMTSGVKDRPSGVLNGAAKNQDHEGVLHAMMSKLLAKDSAVTKIHRPGTKGKTENHRAHMIKRKMSSHGTGKKNMNSTVTG
jgi:hypothetical protein